MHKWGKESFSDPKGISHEGNVLKRSANSSLLLSTVLFLFCTELGVLRQVPYTDRIIVCRTACIDRLPVYRRTFITFKLNEVIYGNPTYRGLAEQLKKEGAYDKELYDPLKKLDSNLGTTGVG